MVDTAFNGLDGSTGEYLQAPLSAADLAAFAAAHPADPAHSRELKAKNDQATGVQLEATWTVDPREIASAGWGVIFAYDAAPELRACLQPLLDHRRAVAGRLVATYYREYAHRPGETKADFLTRNGVANGMPADPAFMPYYLLIVGDPRRIPYRFQYQLDVEYAVGRLWFDHDDGTPDYAAFTAYAQGVISAEQGGSRPRTATFFSPSNTDDRATALSAEDLAAPLAEQLKARLASPDWAFVSHAAAAATKSTLTAVLKNAPALLFTASHGMGFPSGDARQFRHQGALVCQDWPGPRQWRAAIPATHYFSADDVDLDPNAHMIGMVAFLFACYGAGTPDLNDFPPVPATRAGIAPRPFTARLPQRLLAAGAGAVVGHVERAWTQSFLGDALIGRQIQVFEATLGQLLLGYPVGYAMEYFSARYAALAELLATELREMEFGGPKDDLKLASLWSATTDARNYTVFGDPAVKLAVAPLAPAAAVSAAATVLNPAAAATSAAAFVVPSLPDYRDATDYTWTAPNGRRLIVSAAADELPSEDSLVAAMRAYAQQLTDLGGVEPMVEPLVRRNDGAAVVRLSTTTPDGQPPQTERTAMIRYPNRKTVRVTLTAPAADRAAVADFNAVINTIGTRAAAFDLAAAPMASVGVTLPAGYIETTAAISLRHRESGRRVQFALSPQDPPAAAVGRVQRIEARNDRGELFAYDLPGQPPRRMADADRAPASLELPAAAAMTTPLERMIGGRRVRVQSTDTDAAELRRIAEALQAANPPEDRP